MLAAKTPLRLPRQKHRLRAPIHPVEGGSANDYEYADGDPVNNEDLDGSRCLTGVARRVKEERINPKTGEVEVKTREISPSPGRGVKRAIEENRDTIRGAANVLSTVSTFSAFACATGVGCGFSLATGIFAAGLYDVSAEPRGGTCNAIAAPVGRGAGPTGSGQVRRVAAAGISGACSIDTQ